MFSCDLSQISMGLIGNGVRFILVSIFPLNRRQFQLL